MCGNECFGKPSLPPEEYVSRRKRAEVAKIFGQVEWDPDYDYKAERKKR
jgi:hypothetical protein